MAGHKATIDKDRSDYRSSTSAPDGERQTAYDNQKEVEGPNKNALSADRNGNGDDVFKGNTKARQGRRKADQTSTGTPGSMGDALEAESYSPFKKVLASRFGLTENENPGVASSPSTSDNPSLGMYSVNNSDFKQSKTDVKAMLETIALQSAEAFEVLDENNPVPDALASELDQCSKVIDRLYEYATKNQLNNPQTGTAPVENDPATMPVRREETEMNESKAGETYATTTHSPTAVKGKKKKFRIKAESVDGQKFISEKMSKKKCKCAMEEMIASGAYTMVEMKKLSPKQKKIAGLAGDKNKIDAADLATLRAKRKMHEAVVGVFSHLINEGAE